MTEAVGQLASWLERERDTVTATEAEAKELVERARNALALRGLAIDYEPQGRSRTFSVVVGVPGDIAGACDCRDADDAPAGDCWRDSTERYTAATKWRVLGEKIKRMVDFATMEWGDGHTHCVECGRENRRGVPLPWNATADDVTDRVGLGSDGLCAMCMMRAYVAARGGRWRMEEVTVCGSNE